MKSGLHRRVAGAWHAAILFKYCQAPAEVENYLALSFNMANFIELGHFCLSCKNKKYCAKFLQLIQSVGIFRKLCLYTLLEYSVQARLSAQPTGSSVCIWCNILVFTFAGLSIYNYSSILGFPR